MSHPASGDRPEPLTAGHRPRLGLALGGGGARGFAHVGVVRTFIRAGIPVDVLAGTSMGAIVAVAFALGDPEKSGIITRLEQGPPLLPTPIPPRYPGEKESLMNRVRRLLMTERIVTANLRGWGAPLLDVMPILNDLTRGLDLEDAPVRVGVVATDLERGERVLLTRGNAALAAMASAALPLVFPPVRLGGRLLVDGGFVELVPVLAARELGADVVVAVDVSINEPVATVKSGLEALIRAAAIASRQHTEMILRQADVVIRPQFPVPVDTLDFGRARQAIEAGLRAGRETVQAVKEALASRERLA
ncbi:MAG: patatin-like phospholipase family protein [Bacillota bacterium]